MNKLLENNQVTLVGEIKTEFEFSHEVYGEKWKYYAKGGSLGVGRSSTKAIVVSSTLILIFDLLITKLFL